MSKFLLFTFRAALALACAGCTQAVPPAATPMKSLAAGALAKELRNASDWPGFLGPNGDSTSPEAGLLDSWPADGPRILWECKLGLGYAPPSVAGGKLYQFDRVGDKNRLTCRDAANGNQLWQVDHPTDYVDQFGYDGGPRCCPVVAGDRIITYGAEGKLTCHAAADGKALWQIDTFTKYGVVQNFFGVASAPLVDGDRVIVAVGGSPPGAAPDDFRDLKPNGSALVAFDLKTGRELYRTGDELSSFSSPTIRTLAGKRRCLYFARGGLLAIDPADGKVAFRFPWRSKLLESATAANPLVVGDRILLCESYSRGSVLLDVSGPEPKPLWADEERSRDMRLACHWNTPIHVDGFAYGWSGRHANQAEFRCLELVSGKIRWSEPGMGRSSHLLADGRFYVMTESGALVLVKPNPNKYEELARFEFGRQGRLKYPCWAAPVLSHGRLYIRGDGRMLCIDVSAK